MVDPLQETATDLIPRLHSNPSNWLLESDLAPHVEGYVDDLRLGQYAKTTIKTYVACVAHFARWKDQCCLELEHINEEMVRRFIGEHLPCCDCPPPVCRSIYNLRPACRHLLRVLRDNAVIAESKPQVAADDVDLRAVEFFPDLFGPTKGTKIRVEQVNNDVNEFGDTEVSGLNTNSAYDFYGTMALMEGYVLLDGDSFDQHIIKDFWEVDEITDETPPPGTGEHIVLDYGYELITKLGYPHAKWDQFSYLWRSNGGNGYLLIEKHIIAPGPANNPCWITYTALVGDFTGGFQTISGNIELTATATPIIEILKQVSLTGGAPFFDADGAGDATCQWAHSGLMRPTG